MSIYDPMIGERQMWLVALIGVLLWLSIIGVALLHHLRSGSRRRSGAKEAPPRARLHVVTDPQPDGRRETDDPRGVGPSGHFSR
ncbi:hypothetical protein JOL79_04365 [Microbispora sp. RL4-1S]|uniref:Uncharacterized protein n=1 Tax=Microbispora oryzae TaxID=2806554 RepID=A0A941ANT7_9ACTN|nr:hypothetical protein [Microbispora oryzae]